VYCNLSCLWVCDSGRAVSEPYYSQRAQCLRLSERFFSFCAVLCAVCWLVVIDWKDRSLYVVIGTLNSLTVRLFKWKYVGSCDVHYSIR